MVQALTLSPIRPHPNPLTLTVELPKAMGAWCVGQGGGGSKWGWFTSVCRDNIIPLTKTLGDPASLCGTEQCTISTSTICPLHTAGIISPARHMVWYSLLLISPAALNASMRISLGVHILSAHNVLLSLYL